MDKRYLLVADASPGQAERALGLAPGRALATPLGALVEDPRPKLEVLPMPKWELPHFVQPRRGLVGILDLTSVT